MGDAPSPSDLLPDAPGPAVTAGPERTVNRQAISRDLEGARRHLHELLAAADVADLRRRSDGTRWTNERLPFHMIFGFLVVRVLLHFWGSVGAALVFNHARMGWLCDRTIAALQRHLAREAEDSLRRGMAFPTSWDPYFA